MFNLFQLQVLVTLKGKNALNPDQSFIDENLAELHEDPWSVTYNLSTPEELAFIQDVAVKTGIFFDRVYSGKAFKKTIEFVQEHKIENPLFIHTGGVHSISLVFKWVPIATGDNCRH